jgi:hypothetical protein
MADAISADTKHGKIAEYLKLPKATLMNLIVAGLIFGLVARFFIAAIHFASDVFYKYVRYLPLRTIKNSLVKKVVKLNRHIKR